MSLALPPALPASTFRHPAVERFELWLRPRAVGVGLAAAVVVLFLARWLVLQQSLFPPGTDAGGDLYGAHVWTGHELAGAGGFPLLPPVYPLFVVAPATTLLPVFAGIQLYDALVPALIVLPAYALFRQSPVRPFAAGVGAVLLASSAAFSLMLTWNAAYNLFGILLLTGFLAALVQALRTGTRGSVVLCALLFGALAGSHELSFLMAVLTLSAALAVYGLGTGGGWRTRLRRPALLGGLCALAAAPFAGLYLVLARQSANSGIGSFGANLPAVYGNALFFPWGSQTGAIPLLVLGDVAVVAGGILLWTFRPQTDSVYLSVIGGSAVAALTVPVLDASEAVRGLYFLPIPLCAAAANAADFLLAGPTPVAVEPPEVTRASRIARGFRHGYGSLVRRGPVPVAALGLAVFLLGANLAYSLNVEAQGTRFYGVLDPTRVAALDWIRTQTPTGTVVYDGAGLSPWIWGYGERVAYGPAPLWAQSTAASYQAALAADHLDMGAFLVGNGGLIVGSNLPGRAGTPTVFVAVPGNWVTLATSQAGDVAFHVRSSTGPRTVSLATAQFVRVVTVPGPGNAAGLRTDVWWPSAGVGLSETTTVRNGSVDFAWSSNDSAFLSTSWRLSLPPSGYFLNYQFTPNGGSRSWAASLSPLAGPSFNLTATGGSFRTSENASQWSTVDFNGSALHLNFSGLPLASGPAFTLDTSTLFVRLSLTFALVDYDRDYGMFTRLEAGVPGHLSAAVRAHFGSLYLFAVSVP